MSDCIYWQGRATGCRPTKIQPDGTNMVAARWVYMQHWGIAKADLIGLVIRHTCDQPRCVNIEHLVAGTQKQNVDDSIERGRHVRGEKHGCARLTEADVRAIRDEYIPTKGRKYGNGRMLAAKYGISSSQLSEIVRGTSWAHV